MKPRLFTQIASFLIVGASLLPLTPALAESYITLVTFSGTASDVRVIGGGWTPGETISLYLHNTSGSPVTTVTAGSDSFFEPTLINVPFNTPQPYGFATADENGNITFSGTVPYRPEGAKIVQAIGLMSGATTAVTFSQPPMYVSAELGSYAGAPGNAVTFIGHGYAPGETISITSDRNGSATVHTFTVLADGTFSNADYLIPLDFTEGPLTFTIQGEWSMSPVSITYYITG